jgi:hypothetical protein
MNWMDYIRSVFNPYPDVAPVQPVSTKRLVTPAASPRPVPAGRVSTNTSEQNLWGASWSITAPPDHESMWRLTNLDVEHLDTRTPKELLDMLIDLSDEISKAVWDFQRLCNPGYECKVYNLGSDKTESLQGKAHIDEFLAQLRDLYGSVDVVLGRFFMGAYLRGAFCGELVLDAQARGSVDLVAPDPFSVRFRKIQDPIRGEVWQPGQWQGAKFVPLDIPTFRYIPVDPAPASPYGRSLASPALFTAIFTLGLMHDVKRVIMQQGYKRMDIVLDMEAANDAYGYDPQGYATLGEYIKGAIAEVSETYASLEPDDAFFHTDIFTLSVPVGTVDSDSIGAIDVIIERLEKKITRALKSNGVVMDTGENTNETDSNRKWEIHAAGIKSLQHHCENMLESLLNLSLRAAGIQARVEFRFAELRASEMFRDEQTRAMRIQNSRNEYEAGYTSQDESSNNTVGHDADQKEPRKPIVKLDFAEDNNNGGDALNQSSDERGIALTRKPAILNGVNGHA